MVPARSLSLFTAAGTGGIAALESASRASSCAGRECAAGALGSRARSDDIGGMWRRRHLLWCRAIHGAFTTRRGPACASLADATVVERTGGSTASAQGPRQRRSGDAILRPVDTAGPARRGCVCRDGAEGPATPRLGDSGAALACRSFQHGRLFATDTTAVSSCARLARRVCSGSVRCRGLRFAQSDVAPTAVASHRPDDR
mmetsp:Transcript_145081/g.464952  ORF Transcript_145081/g.464952 Transcript_145081/m.464952 type:complete len:201 (-) Transcript_145081:272-874(-)